MAADRRRLERKPERDPVVDAAAVVEKPLRRVAGVDQRADRVGRRGALRPVAEEDRLGRAVELAGAGGDLGMWDRPRGRQCPGFHVALEPGVEQRAAGCDVDDDLELADGSHARRGGDRRNRAPGRVDNEPARHAGHGPRLHEGVIAAREPLECGLRAGSDGWVRRGHRLERASHAHGRGSSGETALPQRTIPQCAAWRSRMSPRRAVARLAA